MPVKSASAASGQPAAREPAHRDVPIDGLVVFATTAIILVAIGAVIGFAALPREAPAAPRGAARFTIGSATLDVPRLWLRPRMPHTGGAVSRLDLGLPWPAEPPSGARVQADRKQQPHALEQIILVSIMSADSNGDPADRPVTLQERFLTPEVTKAPNGLILRRFRAGALHGGEMLYLSPPDGRGFSARCPVAREAATIPEACVADMWIAGLDVQLRFSPGRLEAWERLAGGARRAVTGMMR